jgi:hypothetical protein
MAGYVIYSLDWPKFSALVERPTPAQLSILARGLADERDELDGEFEEDDPILGWPEDVATISADDLRAVEDRAVDEAVVLQERAGLDVVSDGELRRYAFFGHLVDAVDGFDRLGGWAIPFRDEQGDELVFRRPVVVEKLRWRRSMCAEEFVYLRARATRPAKATLISTQQAAAYYDPTRSADAYATRDAYLADVVDQAILPAVGLGTETR